MTIVDIIVDLSSWVIVIVNMVLVFFIFLEWRDDRKPVITTKVISKENGQTMKSSCFTSGDCLIIGNTSNNVAKCVNIRYSFHFRSKGETSEGKTSKERVFLNHLNPDEMAKVWLEWGKIREKYPELFEERKKGNTTMSAPKETLKIDLKVEICFNPIAGNFRPWKIEDECECEWWSFKSCPNIENHPGPRCLNKRNGIDIYKISDVDSEKQQNYDKNEDMF